MMRSVILILFLLLVLLSFTAFAAALVVTGRRNACWKAASLMILSFLILNGLIIEDTAGNPDSLFFIAIHRFQNAPFGTHLGLFLLLLPLSVMLLHQERHYQKSAITRTSIKESMDNLPTGLCFSTRKGIVLLANKAMNHLCHVVTGNELQDAEAFWRHVLALDVRNGAEELARNSQHAILHVHNGQTWSFSRRDIIARGSRVVQITATNTTELGMLRSELEEKNIRFVEMNQRLCRYSEELEQIKSKEERLATKTKIHNEFGYILLATRRMLKSQSGKEEASGIVDLWKQNIKALLEGAEFKEKNALEELMQSARDMGVSLQVKGELPKDHKIRDVVMATAIEALNNAIRHAEATELIFTITETEKTCRVTLANDGLKPLSSIAEGGGLSALRAKIEGAGGIMGIAEKPVFTLWAIVPKERRTKIYDQGFNC